MAFSDKRLCLTQLPLMMFAHLSDFLSLSHNSNDYKNKYIKYDQQQHLSGETWNYYIYDDIHIRYFYCARGCHKKGMKTCANHITEASQCSSIIVLSLLRLKSLSLHFLADIALYHTLTESNATRAENKLMIKPITDIFS